ncbi:unnamed protein product [Schistosoma turkestanicum]|nr:unnamed protein product [Schistosoma turkestanicum]
MAADHHQTSNNQIVMKSNKSELLLFNKICLKENNRLRRLHNCPELKLSHRLMKSAQIHSEYLQELRQLQQITDIEYGQNMALIIGQQTYKIAGLNAIRAWYKQSENYDYEDDYQEYKGKLFLCFVLLTTYELTLSSNNLCFGSSKTRRYFTQMIWKKTRKVGFGFTKSDVGNTIFVVGHYLPAGNKTSEYHDNVLPRKKRARDIADQDNRSNHSDKNVKEYQKSCSNGQCVVM